MKTWKHKREWPKTWRRNVGDYEKWCINRGSCFCLVPVGRRDISKMSAQSIATHLGWFVGQWGILPGCRCCHPTADALRASSHCWGVLSCTDRAIEHVAKARQKLVHLKLQFMAHYIIKINIIFHLIKLPFMPLNTDTASIVV